jgi:hypothetical protein
MKTIEEKIAELEAAKIALSDQREEEIAAIREKYDLQERTFETALDTLHEALKLISEDTETPLGANNGKASIPVRVGLIRAIREAGRPLHLDDLMNALHRYGVQSDRGSVRARLTKGVGTHFVRVADATYDLIEGVEE